MTTQVKICGIRTPDAMTAALEGGADFVGLVFAPNSPRYVDIEVAAYLAGYVPDSVKVVGLFVDAPTSFIEDVIANVRIDMLQLHGKETPEHCASLARHTGKAVVKALPVAAATDLQQAALYAPACDWLLFDAPAPANGTAGGNGETFNWTLLEGYTPAKPWMLAGGLTPENVAGAIRLLRPTCVDVSSGVESSRGVKDPDKIRAFLRAAKAA